MVYAGLALFLVLAGACVVEQHRIARAEAQAMIAFRHATDRHAQAVRLGRWMLNLFTALTVSSDDRRASRVNDALNHVAAEMAGLRALLEAGDDPAEDRLQRASYSRIEKPVGFVLQRLRAEDDPLTARMPLDPELSQAFEQGMAAITEMQLHDEQREREETDGRQVPLDSHLRLVQVLGALLLALAAGAALYLYRSARRARLESADRATLIEQLRHAERKYRSIFENAAEGMFQTTPDGRILTANPALARMYGYQSPDHLIESLSNIGTQLYAHSAQRALTLEKLEREDSLSNLEIELVRADGKTLWVRENVRAVRNDEGGIVYLEGTVVDISDRWWSEQRRALQQATSRVLEKAETVAQARAMILKSICEQLEWDMGAVWDVDSDAGVLRCVEVWHTPEIDIAEFEQSMARVTLAPGKGLAGEIWQRGEPKWNSDLRIDHSSPGALIALKNGMGSAFGVPIKVKGEVRHVAEFFSPQVTLDDPELLMLLGTIATQLGLLIERKTAEEALRKSEMRKAAILHSALDCIISFDQEGRILEFNPAAERAFNYRRPEALGRNISQLLVPPQNPDPTVMEGASLENIAGGLPRSWGRRVEMVARRSDGREFPAEVAISRIRIDDRQMFTAYLRDITARKQAEEVAEELAAVVANSNDAIVGCTLEGVIRSWNLGAERIYGHTFDEVIGKPLDMLMPPECLDELPQVLAAVRKGESRANYETMRLRKDGRKIAVSLTDSPIRGEGGRITGLSSIARDITERRRLEEDLLQSQKMDAVGRLAGGIAHDFNNILTAILGYSDLLIGQIEERHWMYKHLTEIRKAADFAASLTQQLLAFSRRQPLFLRVFCINDTVRNLLKMLQRVIGEQVRIQTSLKAESGRLKADPSQLEQVLLNLCVNARDAMPDGGIISISSADVTWLPDENNGQTLDLPPGEYVRLTVTDTGTGIPPEVMKHIFEPFFTTKDKGHGTGLGLATCYGVVKQSGGHIAVQSTVGHGTSFSVFLPRVDESGEKANVRKDGGALPGGSETILYVEDEITVRSLTAHVMRQLGYTVLEAASGEQARRMVQEQNGHAIDLLFSDVVLPDLSGKELADWVCARRGVTKLLFTSGYVDEGVLRRHGVEADTAFLRKPFSPGDLARKLREVMEEEASEQGRF